MKRSVENFLPKLALQEEFLLPRQRRSSHPLCNQRKVFTEKIQPMRVRVGGEVSPGEMAFTLHHVPRVYDIDMGTRTYDDHLTRAVSDLYSKYFKLSTSE